jgi:NitT/TauT family transport system permease protein
MRREWVSRALDVTLVCVVLVLLWQAACWAVGTEYLPSPLQTVRHTVVLLGEGRFQIDLLATAEAYAVALVVAAGGGILIGLLSGGWRGINDYVEPVMLTLIATPKVMLYPIILLFFGLGEPAKVAFGVLHGLPPVVIMTANALRSIRPIYRKAALTLRLSGRVYAQHVLVPAIFPELVASFRVCFALTLLGVLVGEMFASTKGLGHLLMASIGSNDQPTILTITLLLFLFAGAGSSLLLMFSRRTK